jgi:GTP cyclohydrolase I
MQEPNRHEVLEFPTDLAATEAVTTILRFIGEDPSRDGLADTPERVLRAWREMTSGYGDDPAEILARTFDETSDEMVVLRNISFHSTCEHHLLPFFGEVSVGYLPGKVVGISKLARLVDCFARRLQIQERLTRQIAESIEECLDARGVGVIVRAHHLCMGCRGVRQQNTEMVTSSMLGTLRSDPMARAEFLRLTE